MSKKYVSVSTDPIKNNLEKNVVAYAKEVAASGADFLHCDIMDGKFVKQKTFDEKIVEKINKNCLIFLDVHLMIEKPWKFIKNYAKNGANLITIHYEAFKNKFFLKKCLKKIKKLNVLAGLSINPKTQVCEIKKFLKFCDFVLIMSVEPGLSGQKFLQSSTQKICQLNQIRNEKKLNFKIEVDGGINPENSKQLFSLGTDVVVSGSYVFSSENRKNAINSLKN